MIHTQVEQAQSASRYSGFDLIPSLKKLNKPVCVTTEDNYTRLLVLSSSARVPLHLQPFLFGLGIRGHG